MTSLPIFISTDFSPVITVGEKVTKGHVLAKKPKSSQTQELRINLAEALGIPVKEVSTVLKKKTGDSIKPGEVLAKKRRFLDQDVVEAQVAGTVHHYDSETGELVISLTQEQPEKNEASSEEQEYETIISPIAGTISVCDNEKIVIDTDQDVIVGVNGIGGSAQSELFSLWAAFDSSMYTDTVFSHHIDGRSSGKILLGGKFSRDTLMKSIAVGASGVIGVAIDDEDVLYISDRNITTPIITVSKDDMVRLHNQHNKQAFIEGTNKIVVLL